MKTMIFNGCNFTANKEKDLKLSVAKLKKKGITPKLAVIYVGNNPASDIYLRKKKESAGKVGCKLELKKLTQNVSTNRIIDTIEKSNKDKGVNGVMVQLPLPKKFSNKDNVKIINSINKEKDVDGMRDDSLYISPVVKAVIYILKEAFISLPLRCNPCKVVVVGHTGFEGGEIYRALKEMGYDVEGADIKTKDLKRETHSADVIISVTGVPNLIKESMVKEGCVLIDVGAPDGDVEENAYKKARFVSPVPRGIGPVTVVSLLENLVEACV
ncbi:tetrahydrofolate dehydrogenase/cyclohydrolase catalytic domain-containing protein [Patescibacteria group bacterium]